MTEDLRADALALCEAVNRMHLAISELGLATKAQALLARLAVPASEPSDEDVARELAQADDFGPAIAARRAPTVEAWALLVVRAVSAARERARGLR